MCRSPRRCVPRCGVDAIGADEIERAGDASVALARTYADAVKALLASTGTWARDVAAIGAHGQTIRHRPERGLPGSSTIRRCWSS